MRFFDRFGRPGRATRGFQGQQRADAQDIERTVLELSRRVADLESKSPPEAVEFELAVTNGSTYTVAHGIQGPVRWYITHFSGSSASPVFKLTASSTGTISLLSGCTGRVVVRVESSQYGLT